MRHATRAQPSPVPPPSHSPELPVAGGGPWRCAASGAAVVTASSVHPIDRRVEVITSMSTKLRTTIQPSAGSPNPALRASRLGLQPRLYLGCMSPMLGRVVRIVGIGTPFVVLLAL